MKLNFILFILVAILNGDLIKAQEWQTPVIEGYGKVKNLKEAAEQPLKDKEYKILYHVTSAKEKEGVNATLWHIARQINLFGATDTPAEHVKIVAVISGPATDIVMNNKAFFKKKGKQNPNLDLMQKLKEYGVKIDVCGQATSEHHINTATELSEYVNLALSALIDIPNYQMKGYNVMF